MHKINTLTDIVLRESPLAWWEFDVLNNIVTMNDRKVTVLGYDPKDFEGKGYEALTSLVHPDDLERTMDAVRLVLSGERQVYQIDYRIRDIHGVYHWFMDRGVVIARKEGKVWRLRGIVIDLGKEKEAGANTEALVAMLSGYASDRNKLVVICSSCGRVKISKEEWTTISESMNDVIKDTLSHGICKDCVRKLYPDIAEKVLRNAS